MDATARTYTVTRTDEGRVLTTYSDGSYVLDWSPSPLLDEADDHRGVAQRDGANSAA